MQPNVAESKGRKAYEGRHRLPPHDTYLTTEHMLDVDGQPHPTTTPFPVEYR